MVAEKEYSWECVTTAAAFPGMDGAAALVFKNRMWLLGGWNPHDPVNFPGPPHGPKDVNSRVYSSENGADWVLVNEAAPWEGRHTAGAVVHAGRMWILGGDCIQGHYQPDVWSSADGVTWHCATEHAPWGDRILHITAAFNGSMWVMGGQSSSSFGGIESGGRNEVCHADVWMSVDGAVWHKVADQCPWAPRGMISGSAILNGRMYLMGGGTYETAADPSRYFNNDVWSTSDGVNWTQDAEKTPWDPRQYHDIAAYDSRLWCVQHLVLYLLCIHLANTATVLLVFFVRVLSGCNFGGRTLDEMKYRTIEQLQIERAANPAQSSLKKNPRTGRPDSNRNDVWWSLDGKEWHEVPGTPWLPRHANSVFVFDDSLWMVAGNNGDHTTLEPDSWRLQPWQPQQATRATL